MKILNNLLKGIAVLEFHGNIESPVSSVSINSKEINKNYLFIAIHGNVSDGHLYINEVIEKGATVIIYENDLIFYKAGITYIRVSDTHFASGIIASNFFNEPSRKLKLIGITGTNGKTTTATLLYKLFIKLGHKSGLIGTVENMINEKSVETTRTTPDSITLNKLLAQMVDEGCEYCFMEVSSHSVSEKRIAGLFFSGGLFTNLTLDHLDYHKTLEAYLEAKKGFFDMLPVGAFAISNIDDKKGEYMLGNTKAHKYRLSLKTKVDFSDKIDTKLIGEFNKYNILGVYAVSCLLNQDKFKILEVIKTLDSVVGRFQSISGKNNITGIVDYAHTPDALENILKTLNKIKKNNKSILVIGCGGDRDKSKRPIMAKIGYDLSDILILTSDNPRTEKPEDILEEMRKGIEGLYMENKVYIIVDRQEAINKAFSLSKNNDFILVVGKGHEKYQEVNGVKTHFDDMEELEKLLK